MATVRYLAFVLLVACVAASQPAWRYGKSLVDSREPWIEPLSVSPRAYLFHNFMTPEEADYIVAVAKPFMKRSTVVGANGSSVTDNIRTSYGTFIARLHDPVITDVERRVALWTKLNISHQEDMQVLHYSVGQKYGSHYDSLSDDSPRVATVLLYLNDVKGGGETAFPANSGWLDPSLPNRLGPFSQCAEGHVAAKPRKGDALLFFSLKVDGTPDMAAMHTGCPVEEGVKWTGTIWIHTKPFRPEGLGKPIADGLPFPENCTDSNPACEKWASDGECAKNAGYMIGDGFSVGNCRLACKACEKCLEGDRKCQSRNRERAGYLPLDEIDEE